MRSSIRINLTSNRKTSIMIKRFLHITFRHFRKNLLISLLNIAGLAIGIACFIMIILYLNHELSYDKHNEYYDDIYRVAVDARIGNTLISCTWTPAPMPAAMYDEFPEVMAVTRISDRAQTVKIGDKLYNEKLAAAVDSSFTDIFSLNFIEGSPGKNLNEPGQILLDRSTAIKYFGNEPAYGKVIKIQDNIPLTVTGVYEDFPSQAHFHFNMLISLLTFNGFYNNPQWFANDFKTYLRLKPGFPEDQLEAKFPAFVNKYMFQGTYEESSDDENYWNLYLQRLREIHLGSDIDGEFESNGNLSYIRIFTIVAFILLIVACINYMNLITARSSIRVREIGIRLTNGAGKNKLRQMFLGEAAFTSILATMLAIGLVELIMGPFNVFTGKEVDIHYFDNFLVIPGLLVLTIIVGFLSGIYPAFYMTNLSVINALGYKGKKQSRSWFRNILVIIQFSVAIILIAVTILVQKQMRHVTESALGFNKKQVILVKNIDYLENPETYKNELRKRPEILQVSASVWVPGDKITNWSFGIEGEEQGFSLNTNMTDDSYAEAMGLEIVHGRYFSKDFNTDADKIILNETAVKLLGLEDPIGKVIYLWENRSLPYKVIGVVKDYHWESKHMKVRPHALMLLADRFKGPQYLSVRFAGTDYRKVLETLKKDWEEYVPSIPFDFETLDKHYDGMYQNEQQTRSLLTIFSVIAIVISCLGLFGLAAFITERRTREVGVRKTNGATNGFILRLIVFDFIKWVLLANLLAWPLTWYAMRRWLENFAYRVDIPVWIFGFAAGITIIIAIATVSYHALRASSMSPVVSLKYE